MNRPKKFTLAAMFLMMIAAMTVVMLAVVLPAGDAAGQQKIQASDVERVEAAGRDFIAAIVSRDIQAMEKLWAHEAYTTFIGPLSTTIVVGWDGVRRAWEMRFGQFDRVTISMVESHVHLNGDIAWTVGIERVTLLRKSGGTLDFDAFVTNVFERHDGRWLVVSHQATPVFREAK
jgi:ketosteroid isomerase-like protein